MAAKKQKRMSKEELAAPDEVEVVLSSFWESLYKYRMAVIGGVVGLLILGVVLWLSGRSSEASRASTGDALAEALTPVAATIGDEPEWFAQLNNVPRPPHYPSEAQRQAAAEVSLGQFLSSHGDHPSGALVALTHANLKLRQGDHDGAIAAADAWIASHAASPALPLAHDLRARALVAAGRRSDAVAAYDAAANLVGGTLKAHFLTQLADLLNPAIHDGGDKDKALARYEQALALLPPGKAPAQQSPFGPAESGPRPKIQARIALLK